MGFSIEEVKMAIKDLTEGMKAVDITVQVKQIGEIREFERTGTKNRMTTAIVEDHTGSMDMPLFNEEIEMVRVGDVIRVINGYVGSFNNIKQLRAGKFGRIQVVNPDEEKKIPDKIIKKKDTKIKL